MLIMVLYTIIIIVIIQLVATRTEQRRRTWRADTLLERAEKDLDLAVDCDMVKTGHGREVEATEAWLRSSAR